MDTNDKNGDNPQSTCDDWEAYNNDSTTATFAGCGRDKGESGVGNYTIMSGADRDGSSTGSTARSRTRPLSWILRGNS